MHNSRVVNFKTNYLRSVILTGLIAFIISCNNHEPVTFPADETEFANPVTVPLKFTEPKKINWKVSRSKGLKAPILHAMAIDKLPSKPFYPDGYIPLKQTIGIKSFDINNLPDSSFDISSFPAIPLDIETIKIDQPLISWAGLPKLVEKSGIGLFEFGMDQGMASSIVTAMLQDGHGMIWLATENGLCRFDGEYLESYFFIEKVFNGGQAIVTQLLEDELGRIWIKTDLWVIYVFDRKSAILKKIVVPDAFQVDNDLIRDRHGKIWMGSRDNGLYIIDPAKLAIRHIPKFQEGDSGNVHNLLEDKAGKIWIGSSQGLKIIDPVKKVIRFMFGKSGLLNDTVSALFQSGDGRIWVAVTNPRFQLAPGGWTKRFKLL